MRATLCKSSFTVDAEDVTLECEKGSTELHDMCLTNHSNVNISVQLDAKEHITVRFAYLFDVVSKCNMLIAIHHRESQ